MGPLEFGSRLVDTVTGFTGIATARCEYLEGTISFLLEAELEPSEIKSQQKWFNVGRLNIIASPEEVAAE